MTHRSLAEIEVAGKTFVVAELGQAHDGSLGILHSLIEGAARAGVDAIKFQTHIAEAESSQFEPFRIPFSYVDATRYDYWKRMELTEQQWISLRDHCRELGVEFLSTPFSNAAVDLLERLGVLRYKIGSGDIANPLLMEKIARMRKEVILSTGLATFRDIDAAVDFFRNRQVPVTILQCTTRYPTQAEDIGLSTIPWLKQRYNCPVGLSDHSGKIYAGLAARAFGATVIEVHVTFDKRMFGPDSRSSLTLDELKDLVDGIRFIDIAARGTVKKDLPEEAEQLRRIFGKSLALNKDLSAGQVIGFEDLEGKKPADIGIPIEKLSEILGRKLARDKKRWEFLLYEDLI